MINNAIRIFILSLVLCLCVPLSPEPDVSEQNVKHIVVNDCFSLNPTRPGTPIDIGDTIHYLKNGVVQMYGQDGVLKFDALESESNSVMTGLGMLKADRVFAFPNGSMCDGQGKTTYVFLNSVLILTVIDDTQQEFSKVSTTTTTPR